MAPGAREGVHDWQRIAAESVAMPRFEAARHPHDRSLATLITELDERCPPFRGWWNDHAVLRRTHGSKRYRRQLVGDSEFAYECFEAPGDRDRMLSAYNVAPGSASAEALRPLDSWTASPAVDIRTGIDGGEHEVGQWMPRVQPIRSEGAP